jgi:hypothetical protein
VSLRRDYSGDSLWEYINWLFLEIIYLIPTSNKLSFDVFNLIIYLILTSLILASAW